MRREMTAKVGIAMQRPKAGWENACLLSVLWMVMQLLVRHPQYARLDSTRARCYKSAHPTAESGSVY